MNLKPLLAAGIIAATPFAASAATLIDDFTIFQTVTDESANGNYEQATTVSNPGEPYQWDRRQLRANLVSGENCVGPEEDEICKDVTAVIGDGEFFYDSDSGTESWVEVRYRYLDGDYDLTSTGDAFAFVFDGVESDQEFGLLIRLVDGEDNAVEWFTEGPIGPDGSFQISFDDILNGDGTNLSMLSRIDFRFSTTTTETRALDLQISSITTAIPLPAGVLLMGTALAGFGVMRRRQKKIAA